jgi:hypothetical protein
MVRDAPAEPPPPPKRAREYAANDAPRPPYPAEKARGGEIVLRTPTRRFIFIAGLVGLFVLVLALGLWAA